VLYSPGDDPFVITVGAADLDGSVNPQKASVAPWSAWGYTIDGFAKPELSAPGRYMVGPVPAGSTLVSERPGNVTSPGYMQLSGTSFAAPVVAGAAANILAAHPTWTPDQVKGALMLTAKGLGKVGGAGGVGTVQAANAVAKTDPPNPNLVLDSFLRTSPLAGGVSFDAASWNSTALANASWNSASWNSASWNSASWDSASWNSVSWNSASWNSASWNSASWNSASWNSESEADAATEMAAAGDSNGSGYLMTPADAAALGSIPFFAPLSPLP
jgi:serine protease AprX